jgi:hypothetical protein
VKAVQIKKTLTIENEDWRLFQGQNLTFLDFWLPKTASVLAEISWTHSTNNLANNSSENYRPISSQLPFHNSITFFSFVRFVRSSQQTICLLHTPASFVCFARRLVGFVSLLRAPARSFVRSFVRRTNSTQQFYHQIIKPN